MDQYLPLIVLVCVAVIFTGYAALGWWHSRSIRTPLQFFLADRRLKAPGFVGTLISTNAAVANVFFLFVTYGYLFGVGALFWTFAFWCGTFLVFWWLLKTRLRNEIGKWDTLHEFISAKFFGSRMLRVLAAVTTITCFTIALSSEVVVGSNIFPLFTAKDFSFSGNVSLGLPVLLTFVVAVYISLGGFRTCAGTDKIQAVLLTIALIPLSCWSWPYLWNSLHRANLAELTLLPKYWTFGVFTLLSWIAWSPVAMDMWQRCTAVERRETPLKWIPLSLLWFFFFSMVPVGVGVAMKEINTSYLSMPALSFLEHLLKTNPHTAFSNVSLILIFVGLMAGILATVDTFLLVCSQSLVSDVIAPVRKWGRVGELSTSQAAKCLFIGRVLVWAIPFVAVPCFFAAIQLGSHMVLIFNYAAYSCPLVLLPVVILAVLASDSAAPLVAEPASAVVHKNTRMRRLVKFFRTADYLRNPTAASVSVFVAFSIVVFCSINFGLAIRDHPELETNWDRVYSIPLIAIGSSFVLQIIAILIVKLVNSRRQT